jgi:hypothetical protein
MFKENNEYTLFLPGTSEPYRSCARTYQQVGIQLTVI